jgi:hypothetical protein
MKAMGGIFSFWMQRLQFRNAQKRVLTNCRLRHRFGTSCLEARQNFQRKYAIPAAGELELDFSSTKHFFTVFGV